MSSYMNFEGVYDNAKRYMVYNWSKEDFTQHFGEDSSYNDTKVITNRPAYDLTIKAGEMRELGQFEAYTFCRHFVDREIMKLADGKEGKERERIEMSVNNKDVRKPFEQKTIQEIKPGVETPFMTQLRDKIRKEEKAKLGNPTNITTKDALKPKSDVKSAKEFGGVK
jgi:hypothetical protein